MFWEFKNIQLADVAVYGASRDSVTYRQLKTESDQVVEVVSSDRKKLVFVFCDNSYLSILAYLSFLRAGHAVFLADAKMDESLAVQLLNIYRPELVWSADKRRNAIAGYASELCDPLGQIFFSKSETPSDLIHPDLAVLLSTSGTTGSPKLVRLSYENIQSNAESIVSYLGITQEDRAITTLPLHYSFGLSILHSYLQAGAGLVCTNEGLTTNGFWQTFKQYECTSFSGVPYTFEILERLRFESMDVPSLRTVTQAGGRLAPQRVERLLEMAKKKNFKFFVMYGQTEASPRISYVPFERLAEKKGSIGIAIPGGEMTLYREGKEILTDDEEGELVYRGANVMMGYAQHREDLSKGDEQGGVLFTGDVAYRDKDGFYFLTGRLKRMLKIYGLRINLDEVEKMVESRFSMPVICYGREDVLQVAVESIKTVETEIIKKCIVDLYHIHHNCVYVKTVKALPYTGSGKKDYKALVETGSG